MCEQVKRRARQGAMIGHGHRTAYDGTAISCAGKTKTVLGDHQPSAPNAVNGPWWLCDGGADGEDSKTQQPRTFTDTQLYIHSMPPYMYNLSLGSLGHPSGVAHSASMDRQQKERPAVPYPPYHSDVSNTSSK